MSSPSRTLTVVASASSASGAPSMLTPEAIASSSQLRSAAQASSSHASSRSGAPAWISMYCISLSLSRTERPERPHLQDAEAGHRVPARDLDGLVEVVALEHVEAGDLLLRLGERAVGHHGLLLS